MGSIKDELLLKAQRDLSKLVQVQRMVSRGGKTFPQNFWVKPSEVKSTDKVIGGQQNLLPKAGSVPKPASGVLDKAYFDSLKGDKPKALDYLKSCGVTWAEHTHSGINWMRAMQAFSSALGGQTGQNSSSQVNSQQQSVSQPIAQNSQPKQSAGLSSTLFNKLSSIQQEVNACKNGREKVVVLKKNLGTDGCVELAENLGVTWEQNAHPAINWMRLAAALQQHFDKVDGTVSPTNHKKSDKGGAPKNNQNAKKDNVPPDDKIEIPSGAKEREKNIINLINNITDTKTLETIAKSGFVPEDDGAKEFIENTMFKEYDQVIAKSSGSSVASNHVYYRYSADLGDDISEESIKMFKGLTKKVLKKSLRESRGITESESMYQLISPRTTMKLQSNTSNIEGNTTANDFSNLLTVSREFNTYAKDDIGAVNDAGNPVSCTAVGYSGMDSKIYESQYSVENEGFVHMARHIAKSHPELKAAVDSMVTDYDSMMKSAHYNPVLIETVLSKTYESYVEEHKKQMKCKEAYDILVSAMKSQGFTDDEIKYTTLRSEFYNGQIPVLTGASTYSDQKKDANGNVVKFDASSLRTSDGSSVANDVLYYQSYLQAQANNVGSAYDTELSEAEYDAIIASVYKLSGTKLVDKTTMVEPTKKFHELERYDYRELVPVPISQDENMDAVLSNLSLILKGHEFKKKLTRFRWDLPNSAANNQGQNYDGNFYYYTPRGNDHNFYYTTQNYGYTESTDKTHFSDAKSENALVEQQLSQTTTYSSDYIKSVRDYVENEGNSDFQKDFWGSNYSTKEEARAASKSIAAQKFDVNSSSPAMNILMDQLADAAQYCPQNYNTRVKTSEKLKEVSDGKVGYTRYIPKVVGASVTAAQSSALKQLRQEAFKKAHCSLAKVDDTTRQNVEHTVKINFDRTDPNTGKRVHKAERIYDDRTLVFHSGVYEIKNSSMEEEFQKESQRLGETPVNTFHGTSYSGACGINGVDGRFRFKSSDKLAGQKGSGTMLGEGIYAAKLVGKCCPYIGTSPYSYSSYTTTDITTSNNRADGIIMVCDTVFGKHGEFMDSNEARRNNKNNGGSYDSVAVGAGALMPGGGKLKEYECIVTRQNMIAPKYLVDVGARRR